MKRMFVDTPDGQLHCRTDGSGEPLLLLHQYPCSSGEFSEIIPILAKHFRAVAMDLPLFGDSYKPDREPTIEDFAEAALCFLNALHIEKAHVAGHHTGASVAVELAAEHPERVNKLILSGCPTFSLEEGLAWIKRYKPLELTPDGWFLGHIWQFTMERIPENQMDKAYELALDYMKAGARVEEGHQAVFKYDILPKLAKIKQPTLALCGDKDSLLPYHQPTLAHIPHARSHIINGGNVQTPRLLPNEWAQAILQFLKS